MEANSEIGQMVLETADRICTHVVGTVGSGERAQRVWAGFEAAGLTRALDGGEDSEGFGLYEGLLLAAVPGRHGLALALADTLIAGWIAGRAGLAAPAGALGLVPVPVSLMAGPEGLAVTGSARVAGGRAASGFIASAEHEGVARVLVIPRANAAISEEDNVAGDAVDLVRFFGCLPHGAMGNLPDASRLIRLAGAATRSLLMANALGAALEMTLSYAPGRSQFGQALPKFQAIQHSLAQMASHCAAAKVAALDGARAFARDGTAAWPAVAAAKIRVGEAVGLVSGLAHQIHGATGFTADYPLHLLTRRAWGWRDEFGSESHWSRQLGALVCKRGAGALWPTITTMREGAEA